MFKKLNISIPPQPGAILMHDRAAEILLRVSSIKAGFDSVLVDKPADGSLFLVLCHGSMPEDGYGWMDAEVYSKTTTRGLEIEMFSRNLGFIANAQHVSMRRRRFRLPKNPDLHLFHYVCTDVKVQVGGANVKQIPRSSSQAHQISLAMHQKTDTQVVVDHEGDDLDFESPLASVLARYQKNHDLISLIFSPKSAGCLLSEPRRCVTGWDIHAKFKS